MDDFDLDRYLRASKRVDLSRVQWSRVREEPLTDAEARCLTYMMDIESHTVVFLRDLLATRVVEDADVTAFLSCWAYEELWHGEAFSRFLGEAGYELPPDRESVRGDSAFPSRVGRNAWIRRAIAGRARASHLGTLLGSAIVPDFATLHMTWGAANELSTLTAYHRLIATTRNRVLVDLLTRIIKDERRHFAFYRAQARSRLARNAGARRVTRWAMEHLWAIVGTGVRPQEETDFVVVTLFGDQGGALASAEMDRTIADLPGMEGTRIFNAARQEALARAGPPTPVAVAAPSGV
jgi:rubrerythrin